MYNKEQVENMVEKLENLIDWCSDFGFSAEEVTAEALHSELSYYLLYCDELEMDCDDYMEQAEQLFEWADDMGYVEE